MTRPTSCYFGKEWNLEDKELHGTLKAKVHDEDYWLKFFGRDVEVKIVFPQPVPPELLVAPHPLPTDIKHKGVGIYHNVSSIEIFSSNGCIIGEMRDGELLRVKTIEREGRKLTAYLRAEL